ncbi:MAG: hypothetical protein MJ198_05425 [Bacteroidales bacterium]|nr:hypothetical protein [Bacteroidales bacterium]
MKKKRNCELKKIVVFIICSLSALFSYCQIDNPFSIQGISAFWCADSIHQEDGTKVLAWRSLDSVSLLVSQLEESRAPILKKKVLELNNHAALQFDGRDYLDGGDILNVGTGQTIFVILKSNNKMGTVVSKNIYASAPSRWCLSYEGDLLYFMQAEKVEYSIIGPVNLNKWELISGKIDLNNGKISMFQSDKIQEEEMLITKKTVINKYDFLIGAHNNRAGTVPPIDGLFFTGDIAELIFYDRPLSNIERQSVENYLRSKYFPGTEREQFSLGNDTVVSYGFKPITLTVPDRSYFQTITWSTGETSQSIQVNKSGVYSVFVTDDWGYEYVDTINITMPEIQYIQNQTICDGSSVLWDCGLEGDYTYLWSTGETTKAISITTAGKYALKITDNQGYSVKSDTVVVSVDDFSTKARLGADTTLCIGNSIGLIACSEEAKAYLWNTGDTTSTITIENEGVYVLSVLNDRGCVAVDEIQISIKGIAPIVRFDIENQCFGDSTCLVSRSITTDGTPISKSSWMIENDTLIADAVKYKFSSPDNFLVKLIVETESGCSQSLVDTVTIHPLPVVNFSPKIACQYTAREISPESKIQSNKIVKYEWTAAGKHTEDSLFTFLSDTVGLYPLMIVATSDYGCVDSLMDKITVVESSRLEINHSSICIGDTVLIFDATRYDSFNPMVSGYWTYDGQRISYAEVVDRFVGDTNSHVVSLNVKTLNGCMNIVNDTIRAFNVPHPLVADTVYECVGNSFILKDLGKTEDVVSERKWLVDGKILEESMIMIDFSEAGSYQYALEITTENGCYGSSEGVIVIEATPTVNFSFYPEYGAAPLEVNFTNLSENAALYQWTFEEKEISNEENPEYVFEDKTLSYVQLRASSEHGCSDSLIKHIDIQLSDRKLQIVGVELIEKNEKIQYKVQILNTGNDVIPEMEISLSSSDYPVLTEFWTGALKQNEALEYVFSVQTAVKGGSLPEYVCVSAAVTASEQNMTLFTDKYCIDNAEDFSIYHVAPNPIEDNATISFATKQFGTIVIECFDENGKVRLSQELKDLSVGYHTVLLDCSKLQAGRYVLQMKQGNKTERIPFVKL